MKIFLTFFENYFQKTTFGLDPGPVTGALLRQLQLQHVEPLLVSRGHGVGEPGAVGVDDLQPVVPRVRDPGHGPDLPLQVLDVPTGDDGDLAVGELGQTLQSLLGLWRNDGQSGLLGQEGKGSIKVKNDSKLGAGVHQFPEILLKVSNTHLLNILFSMLVSILNN